MNYLLQKLKKYLLFSALPALITGCGIWGEKADMVLLNGQIASLNDSNQVVEAMAIANDTIIKLGTTKEIKKLIGNSTKVIDLEGNFAMPGFNDAHLHFMGVGRAKMKLDLSTAANWDEIILLVSEAAEKVKPGEWILGRGWHQEKWDTKPNPNVEGYPTEEVLSKATPKNPVLLSHASGHAAFANKMAMDLAGVTDSTKSPKGGKIIRDISGKAIGVFEENAESLIYSAFSKTSKEKTQTDIKEEKLKAIKLATEEFYKYGITSVTDAGSSFDDIDFYKELADSGNLGIRLNVMVYCNNLEEMKEKLIRYRTENYGNHFLSVHSIKKYIDGALGSRGAWFIEEYSDLPGQFGQLVTPIEHMEKTAELAIMNGYQLCTHAIGDRGNREVLELYKRTFDKHPGKKDLRWRIEHAQHLALEDIPKFNKYGVIASMQGIHCISDATYVIARLGSYRAKNGAYPWRKLLQTGAVICNGTDAPIESVNTIENFYALTTRKTKDGREFYPEEKMTRIEALRSYTFNGAYASFEEKVKGNLISGKLADITILSKNLLTCNDDEILKTKVLLTILGGKIVYKDKDFIIKK